jgi:hypothetical protein
VHLGRLSASLMGNAVTLSAADAAHAFHLGGLATTALVTVDPAQHAAAGCGSRA